MFTEIRVYKGLAATSLFGTNKVRPLRSHGHGLQYCILDYSYRTGVLSTLNGRADRSPKSQVGTEFPSWTQLPINSNVVHWVAGRFEETMLNGYVQLLHKAERME